MKVWWCKRGEVSREGGLVVAAETEEDARVLFREHEEDGDDPTEVILLPLDRPAVLHDDENR